ncbi:MAG: ComEC family competence protein [Fimbriimonadales bacterium]|nr:ComEC family competence protein [Fimbriimonadales bacterium]
MQLLSQRRLGGLLPVRAGRIGAVVRPRPMLQLGLGIAAGIGLTEWLALPIAPAVALGLLSLIIGLSLSRWAWLAFGIALGAARYELWRSPPAPTPPSAVVLRAVGTLEPTRNGYRLLCAYEQPRLPTYTLVYFRPQVQNLPDYGDVFRLEASWRRPTRFGGFDWARYLERRRVYYIATVFSERQFQILESGASRWQRYFSRARHTLRETLRRHLTAEDAALVEGMLVGATGDFPPDLREAFHRSGTGHLLATSGLHVAMALQMALLLLRWTPTPFAGRMAILILAAWGYALLAGLRPSIVRAATMVSAALCAPLVGRETDSLNALGLAGALWLLIAPYAVFEAGFQYSFCAVLFILLFYSRLEGALHNFARRVSRAAFEETTAGTPSYLLRAFVHKFLIPLLSVSLCAQAGISLVQLYHFGYMSWLSPVANLLAVPMAYPVLALGFWNWLSQGVGAFLLEWCCAWLKWVALTFGGEWVPALREVSVPAWIAIGFYAGVLLLAPEPTVSEIEEF